MHRIAITALSLLLALGALPQDADEGQDHHQQTPEEKIHFFDRQELVVEDFEASGWILDIGGGGAGVIGRLKGEQVVAIDPSRPELEGAPDGPLKIVMDGLKLQFLDNTFQTATSFFTLMYLNPADRPDLLREVHRVLRPGGRLLVWDVILPPRNDPEKEIAAFLFLFKLPNAEVKTGYGARWLDEGFSAQRYVKMAETAGFQVVTERTEGRTFFLDLGKQSDE